jgi:penicillin-binding protein 1B
MANKSKRKPGKSKPARSGTLKKQTKLRRYLFGFIVCLGLALTGYLFYLNHLINLRFDGDTWAIPSQIYARPLELYAGKNIDLDSLKYELEVATYKSVKNTPEPGQYRLLGQAIELHTRDFEYAEQIEDGRLVKIVFDGESVRRIDDSITAKSIELLRLPPAIIGSYHPQNGEDRLLLTDKEIPEQLLEILVAVEDKQFYSHFGINPLSIARALIANIRAGRTVQGGSTLTQQLAKNMFLTSERSLLRKINEAFMALLLESRFSKQAIITAYINEVFLLQQNQIAIHGFELASRRLFKQSLQHISTDQLALLVGMVKGPSRYNPLANPSAALKRRNLVLRVMRDQALIDESEYQSYIAKPLATVKTLPGVNPFPAYVDMVKRQLTSSYSSNELSAKGLRIFTPFDPIIQRGLETGLKNGLARFDQPDLQAAVVIADYLNGDIQALIGDRNVDYPGFNRAVMAQRPIGSLIKPLLLYSLLEGNRSLATTVDDRPINIQQSDGKIWRPENYDRKFHGKMSLYQAFVKSYNLPFVHLGVDGGLEALVDNLDRIGLLKHDVVYPALLLGTSAMSAFEVAQMYQVIANNGYFTPLTTIRQVSDKDNHVLDRIPLDSHKMFDQAQMIQVQRAMIGVTEEGTARYLNKRFKGQTLAGKTGSTNDTRDSWFSGFSDRMLAVVWLGRDNYKTIKLTGSSGALRVWADIWAQQVFEPFRISRDATLEWRYINRINGGLTKQHCANSVLLPFKKSQIPTQSSACE